MQSNYLKLMGLREKRTATLLSHKNLNDQPLFIGCARRVAIIIGIKPLTWEFSFVHQTYLIGLALQT